MKAKVKKREDLLLMKGASNNWSKLKDEIIINFLDKNTYIDFKAFPKENILKIYTTRGNVEIVFTSEFPKTVEEESYTKDQLILRITSNREHRVKP